jgi:hypothetical protein
MLKLGQREAMRNVGAKAKNLAGSMVLLFALVAPLFTTATVSATPDPALIGGSAVSGYSGVATPITDLQVSGTGNPTVPVKLRVTSGSLAMSTTTGISFTTGPTGATLQFSGTLTNVNAALATLAYTRSGTGTDTLEASLVAAGEVFFPDNGHLYEYVSFTSTWNNAKTNAEGRMKYSSTGYLTTITSQAENDFVAARLLNAGWMGASDIALEGDWKWVVGPEATNSFWLGDSTGGTVSGRYANWGTGEPNNAGDEDCAQFLTGGTGKWNDLPCNTTTLPGYVVEYGGVSPLDISSKNVSITTAAANTTPNVPTSLGATAYVNGSWGSSASPSLGFSLSDPNGSDTVRYRVQIDDSSDFGSPLVDYTSALAAQGARTFTVGQTAGSGTYNVGSASQALGDGSYYWRVKTIDNSAAESSYTTANSGAIAFKVDTTRPTVPGTPTTVTPTADSTPTWTWAASTDSGSGMALSNTYALQYTTDPLFGTYTTYATLTSPTYTHTTPLADGTWYSRVVASDAVLNTQTSLVGSVVIDTSAPTTPGTPTTTSAKTVNTPTMSWDASTDSSAITYVLEWSPTADFSGTVLGKTTTTATYALPDSLSDGTWYFRVHAIDAAGNTSSKSGVLPFIVDTSIPKIEKVTKVTTSATEVTEPVVDTTPVVASPSSGDIIVLNRYEEYVGGTGKDLSLKVGQVIYFNLDDEQHTATIKEVGSDYVIVTIASTPTDVRIPLGQDLNYDVNKDGVNDINISFKGVTEKVADMTFKQLAETPSINRSARRNYNWIPIITMVTLAIVVFYWAGKRKVSSSN